MSQMSLSDAKLVLLDLINNPDKQKALKSTKTWALYEQPFRDTLDQIQALPPALVDSGRPLAEQLAGADGTHDGWGLFILLLCEAYRAHPALEPDLVKVLDTVRDHVIASKKDVYLSYPKEAARAVDRAALLPKLKAGLKLIPLAGAKAKTLADAVQHFTDAGVEINALLSERGTQQASVKSRAAATTLRVTAQGLLSEARGALATEIRHSKGALSEDLDGAIFGYLDVLLKAQAERDAAAAAAEKAAADKAAAGGTPGEDPSK